MPDNVCLANLAGAIYQKNLRRTRLQVLLSAQFDFVIKHTNSPNQKKLLTKTAKDMGYTNIVTYVDDGVSGATMDRPGFNEMMRQLEEGKASALFVKDLSRLGRNCIEVGRPMEEFFPEHDIRLVAVSDTATGKDNA